MPLPNAHPVDLHRDRLSCLRRHFVAHLLEEHAAQVALAKRWQHHHDQLAGIFRARAHADRRDYCRTRRDAHQQAFFDRQPPRHHQRIVARDLHHFVDVVGAQNAGDEARADALNLVWRRLSARENGLSAGSTAIALNDAFFGLMYSRDSRDRAASTDARNQDVDFAIGVVPDFRPGGLEVNLRDWRRCRTAAG